MSKDKFELRPSFFSQPFTLALGTQYLAKPELTEEPSDDEWSAAQLLGRVGIDVKTPQARAR